jgi:hypothetical protein
MQKFDNLKIQRDIEEKRLILGQKFENFLLKNLRSFLQKFNQFLNSKSFCFWSFSAVFLLSIFLRSRLDIGGDSAFYIDTAAKMYDGGKYYYDFFESNFPISFWLHLIPYSLAKFFNISPIITADIFVNLLGVLSITYSALILRKSSLRQDHQNLLVTSFAIGFFLRVPCLEINEFLTKTSFLLCVAYPYISFSFSRKMPLNKKEMLWRGFLAVLIPCIKPHYIFLPLLIEAQNFWQKKSLKSLLELDKITMLLLGMLYIFLMLQITPEYFKYMVPMWSEFYVSYGSINAVLSITISILGAAIGLFGGIFLIFMHRKISKDDRILSAVFIAASLILISEALGSPDQVACFFAMIFPVCVKFFYDFLQVRDIDLAGKKLVYLFLIIFAVVAPSTIIVLNSALIVFWWIVIPIVSFDLFEKLKFSKIRISTWIVEKKASVAIFITILVLLVLLSAGTMLVNQRYYVAVAASAYLFCVFCYEKIYVKIYNKCSVFFIVTQFVIISTLIALLTSSIFSAYKGSNSEKSPNYLSEKIAQYAKFYLSKDSDEFSVWSNRIAHTFPITTYFNRQNSYIHSTVGILFDFDSDKKNLIDYFYSDLKKQIASENMKLIFINNGHQILDIGNKCSVGFLENYFHDAEFKQLFLENYYFVGRIFTAQKIEESDKVSFFSEEPDKFDSLKLSEAKPLYDFEVYARKNDR